MTKPLYMRYTGLLTCFVCSFLFMALQGGKVATMIFFVVAIISTYLLLGRWSGVVHVKGARQLPAIDSGSGIEAGTKLNLRLQFQVPGVWPIPYVVTHDRLTSSYGKEYVFEHCFVPDWYRRGEFEYETNPLRRGLYQFEETACATEDIFGLFRHEGQLRMKRSFRVTPKTVPIRNWQQWNQVSKGVYHSATTLALRETTQINGVRDYVYGDRLSRIHWNATARTGKWKSKEFERESLPKMMIVLDGYRSSYRTEEQFELAVSVAASIMEFGATNSLSQGLIITDESSVYVAPQRHAAQRSEMMNHFILTEASGNEPLSEALEPHWDRIESRCFVVFISADHKEPHRSLIQRIHQSDIHACYIQLTEADDVNQMRQGSFTRSRSQIDVADGRVTTIHLHSLEQLPHRLGGQIR